MKTILVTGANGQLGQEIRAIAGSFPNFQFAFLTREDLQIHELDSLTAAFDKYAPDYLINCAAYTAVDKAESEQALAYQINAEAVGNMATLCAARSCKFIHVSTDYVFDGKGNKPYQPSDATNPQSVYGSTKLEGERLAQTNNPDSIIIRTSWVYSEFGKNFVKTMLRLMAEKPEINVVADQFGCPTYAADLAAAIMQIIYSGNWVGGLYHYCNDGAISWHQFATAIGEEAGFATQVNPIPSSAYPTPAQRPAYSVLNNQLLAQTFQVETKPWRESLRKCLARVENIS